MTKKLCTMAMSVLLSLLVVYLTVGASFVQCQCTGITHILNPFDKSNYEDIRQKMEPACAKMASSSLTKKDCMKHSVEKLSDSVQPYVFAHNFSIDQPVLFTVGFPTEQLSSIHIYQQREDFCPDKIPIPPRRYLALTRVLII